MHVILKKMNFEKLAFRIQQTDEFLQQNGSDRAEIKKPAQ